MESKVQTSLNIQKQQLTDLEAQYAQLAEMIQQVKGSIAALEYVVGLGLVEPTEPVAPPPDTPRPSRPRARKAVVTQADA